GEVGGFCGGEAGQGWEIFGGGKERGAADSVGGRHRPLSHGPETRGGKLAHPGKSPPAYELGQFSDRCAGDLCNEELCPGGGKGELRKSHRPCRGLAGERYTSNESGPCFQATGAWLGRGAGAGDP